MTKNLVFDGKSLSDFGIRAFCLDPFATAAQNVSATHVDGMNGDLHFYPGDFNNVDVTYRCIISTNFKEKYAAFRSWLYSLRGYKKLEDGIYPEEFRMAVVLNELLTKTSSKDPNSFEVTFSCKPQRFLKSGEQTRTYAASGSILNPTRYAALPLIRVYGTGELAIGEETITLTANDGYTDIDCELQDAYHEGQNRNGNIKLSSGDFFHLEPGKNGIKLASGMSIEITPRWYTI